MTPFPTCRRVIRAVFGKFRTDQVASSAVEFSLVALPFIALMLGILQMGVFYMTQSSLDAGTITAADSMNQNFMTSSNASTQAATSASSLKSLVLAKSEGLIHNDQTLAVEIRRLSSLTGALVPIQDGTVDFGSATSPLALRAQASVVVFAPFFNSLAVVRSSAMVRRHGF